MNNLLTYLQGGDLRSIANANKVVSLVKSQTEFDELFQFMFSNDRLIVMRAADAIEKITLRRPDYLKEHNREIIELLKTAVNKEFKWHLALMASRLNLTTAELGIVWDKLTKWSINKKESKIVRVNSIQSLFDLSRQNTELKHEFELIVREIEAENIASINARLRKLKIKE